MMVEKRVRGVFLRNLWYCELPCCTVGICEEDGAITRVFFKGITEVSGYELAETALIRKTEEQLREYFAGVRQEFDLPLAPRGTAFQQACWAALRSIPYGETRSYGEIAAQVGNAKASRAVGMANNRNPIAIIVPCHRVIGSTGKLVGYAGGLDVKQALLELEGR